MKIAIIGAGPRGLLVAHQIMKEITGAEVTMFDTYGIGGKVWQPSVDAALIMNTPAEQVQEFTESPNLYEWSQTQAAPFIKAQSEISDDLLNDLNGLDHNGYAPRRLYGAYLKACLQTIPHYQNIQVVTSNVTAIEKASQQLRLTFNQQSMVFDKVIMAISNGDNQLNPKEQELHDYAVDHHLNYFAVSEEVKIKQIKQLPAHHDVIVRGLGLNLYDLIAQLTNHWGGHFYRDDSGIMQYQKSGHEFRLIIGSRKGLPHYPRPINQDGPVSNLCPPHFLTIKQIHRLIKQGQDAYQAFIHQLNLEIEYRYATQLVDRYHPEIDLHQFQAAFIQNQAMPSELNEKPLDLAAFKTPVPSPRSIAEYQTSVLKWVQIITDDAKLGSQHAQMAAVFNVIRELYNAIREIYVDPTISDGSFKAQFSNGFGADFPFLISGAPIFRVEQLAALIRAGVMFLLPPQMKVVKKNHHFVAYSTVDSQNSFQSESLIEARLPGVNVHTSTNPLIQQLMASGLMGSPKQLALNCANIDETYHVIDANQQPVENLYLFGLLTNGLRWLTNVCPRSGEDLNRKAAEKIVTQF